MITVVSVTALLATAACSGGDTAVRAGDDDQTTTMAAPTDPGSRSAAGGRRADAPTTTFTLVDGGRRITLDAYALGFDDAPTLSAAQKETRRRLGDLAERMQKLGAAATGPNKASAVSVLVLPYAVPEVGAPAPEPAPGQATWPLGDLSTGGEEQFGGRCIGLTGADAAKVLAAAGKARSNTRWQSGDKDWSLLFRPELPGVRPCTTDR